jgi:hypothetical protein
MALILQPECWIVDDNPAGSMELTGVANDVAVIVALPYGCARGLAPAIDTASGHRFEIVHDGAQAPRLRGWGHRAMHRPDGLEFTENLRYFKPSSNIAVL